MTKPSVRGFPDMCCPICDGKGMVTPPDSLSGGDPPVSGRVKCPCVSHDTPLNPNKGCAACGEMGYLVYEEPIVGPRFRLCTCVTEVDVAIPSAPTSSMGQPKNNCKICYGRGKYFSNAGMAEEVCPCLTITHILKLAEGSCRNCDGTGFIKVVTQNLLGKTYEKRHCPCTTYKEKITKPVSAARKRQLNSTPADGSDWPPKPTPTHTDTNMDYSHWPGPHMTSFVLDVKNDKGSGQWVVMSRDDDNRVQRLHVESIEQAEDPHNPGRFIFTVIARDLNVPGS